MKKTTRTIFNFYTVLLLSFFFSCISGCTTLVLPPPSTLQLSALDTTTLKDKIIIIDPGHGGPEYGAVGAKGIRESEINLGVALYLWGLLKQAGALPILTRSADTALIYDQEYILQKDLYARSQLSNTHRADLFLSIHHNSDTKNRKRNDLQIYYKMSDQGPSLDIAREIFCALKNRLNIPSGSIFPGNYFVLRNTEAPAILGEASFVSNKNNEAMLAFQRTLQLEAEGYFYGILHYYKKGIPVITALKPAGKTLSTVRPEITAKIITDNIDNADNAVDPSTIVFSLDDNPVHTFSFRHDGTIYFKPQNPLANGRHQFCISCRNRAGNASQKKCATLDIASPPCTIKATPLFPVIPPGSMAITPIDIHVYDCYNHPVADGTMVWVSATAGSFLEPCIKTINGYSRAILTSGEKPSASLITVKAGSISTNTKVLFAIPKYSLFIASVRDPSGYPVVGVSLARNGVTVSSSDLKGFLYDRCALQGSITYTFYKAGYLPVTIMAELINGKITMENILLKPVDGGIFFNKKIMLNPAGSSRKSFSVISHLKNAIEHAGGTVVLTWSDTPPPTPQQRIAIASKENAHLFLTLEISGHKLSTEFYFKSALGKILAETICNNLEQNRLVSLGDCSLKPSNHFVIVQTGMPSLWVTLPQKALGTPKAVADLLYHSIAEAFLRQPPMLSSH